MAKTGNLWQGKIGNVQQLGGIETAVLDNGPGRGSRVAWVNTGSPLRFRVAIDRGLDIVDAFYNQHSLAWLSHGGLTVPRPDASRGVEWLYSFPGGLMTTCGLSHMGRAEADEAGERGLHGRYSNLPAELLAVRQPELGVVNSREVARGQNREMSITGLVRESRVFGPNFELRRTISCRLGEAAIRVSDTVTNRGNTPQPHMILYHCNFGWPLVDAGTEIVYQGVCESRGLPMDDELFNARHNYRKCAGVLEKHRAGGEACGFIQVRPERSGVCRVGLVNRKLGLAVELRYNKKQLPWLANWQHFGPGEYVTGLEPGTNPPVGQAGAREMNELIMLEPGEERKYELEFQVM